MYIFLSGAGFREIQIPAAGIPVEVFVRQTPAAEIESSQSPI